MVWPTNLGWIPNSVLKGVYPLPEVIFEEEADQAYSGFYREGTNKLVAVAEGDRIAGTIAHELKHYLQYLNKQFPSVKNIRWPCSPDLSYEKNIRVYFRGSMKEFDALVFEHKLSKDWLNDWWLRKLVLE
jgi:hypothetical protein